MTRSGSMSFAVGRSGSSESRVASGCRWVIMPERGVARAASDDYNAYGHVTFDERGKPLPCSGCGEAPDHKPDDQKCVQRRVEAVRRERARLEEAERGLAKLPREDVEIRTVSHTELTPLLRQLMVD